MKRIIILSLLAVPSFALAQSEWEIPDAQKPKVEQKAKVKESTSETKAKGIDPKYGIGQVPLVDGKVEWSYNIKLPNVGIDDIYNRAIEAITALTKQENQSDKSRLTAVNKHEHIVAAYIDEEMVFASSFLSKDFTNFRYTFIATAKPGELELRLCRISFAYEMNRPTGKVYTAEELLPDAVAMNKKQTKFYPMNGKFRRTAIDRKDEIFTFIEDNVKQTK